MVELTKDLRKRLAVEARKLASEIVEGAAPEMDRDSWCGCAMAVVCEKSGVSTARVGAQAWPAESLEVAVFRSAVWSDLLVSCGLLHSPEGAVFPLLYFADRVEAPDAA